MNSPALRHPDEAELMRFLDGELSEREARALRRHTDSCWQCRRDLNEMQTTIDAYLRLREAVSYPPAPREWAPLRLPVFEEARGAWPLWRVAVAAGVVFAGVIFLRPTTPVAVKKAAPAVSPVISAPLPVPVHSPIAPTAPEKGVAKSLVSREVEVLAGLHRVRADLGEPVEVIVEKEGILVRGTALDPGRAAVIRDAVAGARLELIEPKAALPADGIATVVVSRPAVFGIRDDAANAVVDESDAIVARAHALGRLAARFQGVALSAEDAESIREIENDHRASLRQHVGQLRKLLAELRVPEAAGDDSRPMSELARDLDELVSAGFGGAQSALSDVEIAGRLQRVLRGLAR
jgi:anti-sigma factor RsiW